MDTKVRICTVLAFAFVASLGCAMGAKQYVGPAPQLTVEWTWNVSKYPQLAAKNLYDVTLGAIMVDDIDKDGSVEILWPFRKAEDRVICLSSKTKDLKWVYPPIDEDPFPKGDPWGLAAIEDIDGDGAKEILIIARDGNLHCITPAGAKKWMYECGGSEIAPALFDVNNDGKLEIVIGPLKTALVTLLDNTGKKIWDFPVASYANCGSTAFDVDKDGDVEVLTVDGAGNFYCLSSTGAEKWRFKMGDRPNQFKPVVADVNNDNEYEILVHSKDRWLYCLTFYGTEAWKFPVGRIAINATHTYWDVSTDAGISEGGIAVADVDGDGTLEVLVGDWIGNFHCIDGVSGTEEWYTHFPYEIWTGVTVGDVNGDGKLDVVTGSDGDEDPEIYQFFGLSAPSYPEGVLGVVDGKTGATLGTYPEAPGTCQAMGDLDGDGKVEIAAYLDSLFYMLTMDGKYDASLMPWPLRFKNLHNNPVVPIAEPSAFASAMVAILLAQGLKRRG